MSTQPLFTLPVPSSNGGTFTCTTPSTGIYLLTFSSPPDNRLVTPFINTFLLALDILEDSHPRGVLITTSSIAKFYSNGLDLEHASSTPKFFAHTLFGLWARLLTYPMPTIALVNGHAFAGGLMTAMFHDYRVFNPARGFLCLNELEMGVPLKAPMSSIFREKLSSAATYRSMVLEAKRFNAKEALEAGIVDVLGAFEEAMKMVAEKKLTEKAKSSVYGDLKSEMYRETLDYLLDDKKNLQREEGIGEMVHKRSEDGKRRVTQWKARTSKAKL